MAKSSFCKNCIHWEGELFRRIKEVYGICDHPLVLGMIMLDTQKALHEEKALYTEQFFGCIHFQENDGSLFSTDEIIS